MQLHARKKEDAPLNISSLSLLRHGLNAWDKSGAEPELLLFDKPTNRFVSLAEFRALRQKRAEMRRLQYPEGRRKPRRSHASYFVRQPMARPYESQS